MIPATVGAVVALWMSPIPETTDASPRVVITEIMYDPASRETAGATEWVEIANVGDAPIAIRNWRLDDEDRTSWGTFSVDLDPGEVAVLINGRQVTAAEFRDAWDAADNTSPTALYPVLPVKWGGLANAPSVTNELLTLLDGSGRIVCHVNLHGDGHWPDGRDASVYLMHPATSDPNDGSAWRRSEPGTDHARSSRTSAIFNQIECGSPGVLPRLAEPRPGAEDTVSPPSSVAATDVDGVPVP
ncbi:MAG: lamin tail domain-containing protein [Planctomycetota bacterium]